MTPQIQQWVKKAKEDFIKSPGRVLEIGSLDVNGGIRHFFSDAEEYIGIDMKKGSGVDKVMAAKDILTVFGEESFNTILCLEMLEHDIAFWHTLDNIKKVLKKGGILLISTPTFGFPLHRYPKDYFRFGVDAYKEMIFKDFSILRLSEVKDREGNPGICCIGKKTSFRFF